VRNGRKVHPYERAYGCGVGLLEHDLYYPVSTSDRISEEEGLK
jgi:hypothetical protein